MTQGCEINVQETKVMVATGRAEEPAMITKYGTRLETDVEQFVYDLGSMARADGNCRQEIRRRIMLASSATDRLGKLRSLGKISLKMKLQLLGVCVFSEGRPGH